MVRLKEGALLLSLLIACTCTVFAQQALISRSSNLRAKPNRTSTIVATLSRGATATLISTKEISGYVHVRMPNGQAGWVLAKNVSTNVAASPTSPMRGRVPQSAFHESCEDPSFPAGPAPIDSTSCALEGNGGAEAAQNDAKNNFCAVGPPIQETIGGLVALQKKVQQDGTVPFGNNHNHPLSDQPGPATDRGTLESLGEGHQVILTGYVKIARREGAESVNCGKNGPVPNTPPYHDIHISIVPSHDSEECDGIVAEMIPHHRPEAWTPQLVNQVAKSGLEVRLTGNLMFDSSHTPCQGGVPLKGDPSRASLWEVHPIYRFEVCTEGDCSADNGWVDLDNWQPQ